MTTSTPTTYSPEHLALARAWAIWNGQAGTTKQAERYAQRLNVETLRRLLSARGIAVQ